MSVAKKAVAVGATSVLALGGLSSAMLMTASVDTAQASEDQAAEEMNLSTETAIVKTDVVVGKFNFTQTEVTSIDDIAKNLAVAAKYLCNSTLQADADVAAEDWAIAIAGEVKNPAVGTVEELTEQAEVQSLIMGCSCMGNPSDGQATVNAEVTGIGMHSIIDLVQPAEEANTVVFTSADGYSVALPLTYVTSHYCPIVFDINGAKLADSVGGVNQLWLGSTPASYFVKDVVSIEFEARQTPPPSPTSDEARSELATLPNIGVVFGGEVA